MNPKAAKSYTINTESVRETDNNLSRIAVSGEYIGKFTLARHIKAMSGAVGIQFSFESVLGQTANNLTLYTENASGEPIYGSKQLYALMTCLKQRTITPKTEAVDVYDYDQRVMVKTPCEIYPTLMNVPVGVVLQKEEYMSNSGERKIRMTIVRFFDAATRQTASEILDKAPAKNLDAFLLTLKDKLLPSTVGGGHNNPISASSVDAEYNDDIPFN